MGKKEQKISENPTSRALQNCKLKYQSVSSQTGIVLKGRYMMSDFICKLEVWNGFGKKLKEDEADLQTALSMKEDYRKDAILFAARNGCSENVLYSVIQHDEELDIVTKVSYFKGTSVTDDDIEKLICSFPAAEFGIIYARRNRKLCMELYEEEKSIHIAPITLRDANRFVTENHRHHDSVTGCKFAVGLYKVVKGDNVLIGTAICGRPVSRFLDDGYTLEINRLCVTEREKNGCSMLYGACCRIAKEMGYRKIITYILESESGVTLRASNFILEDECCGRGNWTGSRKRERNSIPEEMKQRWVRILSA